jgi:hypothetical protein
VLVGNGSGDKIRVSAENQTLVPAKNSHLKVVAMLQL